MAFGVALDSDRADKEKIREKNKSLMLCRTRDLKEIPIAVYALLLYRISIDKN
jgi:hypothetical protein